MASDKDTIIKVTNAAVRFNMASERIDNLKEYFAKLIKRELMFQEFMALKDINFEVKRGEAWGLIGTNGSGKSTLLKLICGILKPYRGTVEVRGSIAPLIELGAGFDHATPRTSPSISAWHTSAGLVTFSKEKNAT